MSSSDTMDSKEEEDLICLMNIDTLSLALIATELNITNILSAMHYVFTVNYQHH